LGPADLKLDAALIRAAAHPPDGVGEPWQLADPARICSPIQVGQEHIDAEELVVVAAGLNYAAHAEEAGGGDVFLFPKPVAPTGAYGSIPHHSDVTLLDYEVELGFVLLHDVVLADLPERDALLRGAAFFVANDVSDREPIILQKSFSGPGTGFVEGKGRSGYLPAGPWLVRGTELFAALAACDAVGLGLHLDVDDGGGFVARQSSSTARMILDPLKLLERIAAEVASRGLRTPMPMRNEGAVRYYPLAVDESAPRLPAGSLVLTGTPDGVAIHAPQPMPVLLRGLVRLRSPFEQFRLEELDRARVAVPGGYLNPGDVVRARIDGLGTQIFRIGDSPNPPDPCRGSELRRSPPETD
jgi:2-keto-4-pentenoate hydratase/2-oxohepta-3-ene-1,7-dioic acid hydratase in catechol pathway